MTLKTSIYFLAFAYILFSCTERKETTTADSAKLSSEDKELREAAQIFIDTYTARYLGLYYSSSKAEWQANTMILPNDTTIPYEARVANEALAEYTGSEAVINDVRKFLEEKEMLSELQVKQLETILYTAANNPATVSDIVKKRIKAETDQNQTLFGYEFKLGGKALSANDIDNILRTETNKARRLAAWNESKEVGKELKVGLKDLRDLRNQTVQALGYDDYFTYQVSEYDMSVREMLDMNEQIVKEIWPLYRQLHTYARYELAKKFGADEVPEMLPAHWLPNRWAQDWSSMVEVEGIDLSGALKEKGDDWLVKQAERFYVSLGFEPLPTSFYELSSLYPLPKDAHHKKNSHASAWHMDLNHDVRSLMSLEPNAEWYETTHHELGHIYYYMSYTNKEVPALLRRGANRAFHEAVGSMMGLAAMQKPFLQHLGLISADLKTDQTQQLLKEALNYVVFIPFSAGVMTNFEHDLYVKELSESDFNRRWWALKEKYQGVTAPSMRGEEYCDAASKTHINNDAAQYYDYALSYVLLFQLHDQIAKNILKQDPHATNYYGQKEVGDFLRKILAPGATRDWRQLLKESTGEFLSANAMVAYFEPLMDYLEEKNRDREHTLPESI